MTPAQQSLYWREFGAAWKVLLTLGRKPENKEIERKRLHVRIGAVDRFGKVKSSKIFNNADVDRWRKLCQSYSNPESLPSQLEIDAMPVKRALTACEPLLDELGMHHDQREAYVAGIYRNVQRGREGTPHELHEMPDDDLERVLAALTHTVRHKLGIEHNHPTTGKGMVSKYHHRVGYQKQRRAEAAEPVQEAPERVESPDPQYVPPQDDEDGPF